MKKEIKEKEIDIEEAERFKRMHEAIKSGFFDQPLGEPMDFDDWYKEQLEEAEKEKQKILNESKEERERREKREQEEWDALSQEDKDWIEYMMNLEEEDSDEWMWKDSNDIWTRGGEENMFSERVVELLRGRGVVQVRSFKGSVYNVRLNNDVVELCDRNGLKPIELALFDFIEELIHNGITRKGCMREKIGTPKCDGSTIAGNVGVCFYGQNEGDSMIDASCYIYAILEAAGCIRNRRGYIEAIQ